MGVSGRSDSRPGRHQRRAPHHNSSTVASCRRRTGRGMYFYGKSRTGAAQRPSAVAHHPRTPARAGAAPTQVRPRPCARVAYPNGKLVAWRACGLEGRFGRAWPIRRFVGDESTYVRSPYVLIRPAGRSGSGQGQYVSVRLGRRTCTYVRVDLSVGRRPSICLSCSVRIY